MRTGPATCAALLAQMDRFRNMGRNFRGEGADVSTFDLVALVVVVVVILAGVVVLYLSLDRRDRQRKRNSPAGLLRELCQAHGLPRSERRLLERAAAHQNLTDPGYLFVRPELLDAAMTQAPADEVAALRSLRERLFGEAREPASA